MANVYLINEGTYYALEDSNGKVLIKWDTSGEVIGGSVAAKSEVLGIDQDLQTAELTDTGATFLDGTLSYRAVGQTYVNNTGKPIELAITVSGASLLEVDGETTYSSSDLAGSDRYHYNITVKDGGSYRLASASVINSWRELRANS